MKQIFFTLLLGATLFTSCVAPNISSNGTYIKINGSLFEVSTVQLNNTDKFFLMTPIGSDIHISKDFAYLTGGYQLNTIDIDSCMTTETLGVKNGIANTSYITVK